MGNQGSFDDARTVPVSYGEWDGGEDDDDDDEDDDDDDEDEDDDDDDEGYCIILQTIEIRARRVSFFVNLF